MLFAKKVKRIDGAQSYHRYCPKCFRMFIMGEIGCNYCSSCGQNLEWDNIKFSENWNKENQQFQKLIKLELKENGNGINS